MVKNISNMKSHHAMCCFLISCIIRNFLDTNLYHNDILESNLPTLSQNKPYPNFRKRAIIFFNQYTFIWKLSNELLDIKTLSVEASAIHQTISKEVHKRHKHCKISKIV